MGRRLSVQCLATSPIPGVMHGAALHGDESVGCGAGCVPYSEARAGITHRSASYCSMQAASSSVPCMESTRYLERLTDPSLPRRQRRRPPAWHSKTSTYRGPNPRALAPDATSYPCMSSESEARDSGNDVLRYTAASSTAPPALPRELVATHLHMAEV